MKALNSPILMLSFFHPLRRAEEIMIRFCNLTWEGLCLLEPFSNDSLEIRKCLACLLLHFTQFLSKQNFSDSNLVIHLQNKVFYKVLKFNEKEIDKSVPDFKIVDFCFRNFEVKLIKKDVYLKIFYYI